eukprot:1151186-Pelagomonas_calceolata.AAC.3
MPQTLAPLAAARPNRWRQPPTSAGLPPAAAVAAHAAAAVSRHMIAGPAAGTPGSGRRRLRASAPPAQVVRRVQMKSNTEFWQFAGAERSDGAQGQRGP